MRFTVLIEGRDWTQHVIAHMAVAITLTLHPPTHQPNSSCIDGPHDPVSLTAAKIEAFCN